MTAVTSCKRNQRIFNPFITIRSRNKTMDLFTSVEIYYEIKESSLLHDNDLLNLWDNSTPVLIRLLRLLWCSCQHGTNNEMDVCLQQTISVPSVFLQWKTLYAQNCEWNANKTIKLIRLVVWVNIWYLKNKILFAVADMLDKELSMKSGFHLHQLLKSISAPIC